MHFRWNAIYHSSDFIRVGVHGYHLKVLHSHQKRPYKVKFFFWNDENIKCCQNFDTGNLINLIGYQKAKPDLLERQRISCHK